MREAYHWYGRTPYEREYGLEDLPSLKTVINRFGSLRAACEAAGIPHRTRREAFLDMRADIEEERRRRLAEL